MKYYLYALLLLLIVGCKNSQVSSVKPIEIQAPDSLPDPLSANGWVFIRTSINGGLYVPPSAPRKVKLKNVGNDYSKVKDTGNYTDKSTLKDKSKAKEKTKADIIGDGNSQVKPEVKSKFDWLKWLSLAIIVGVGGYVFGPIIRNFFKR